MNSRLSNDIKAEALRLGFFACGIAKAEAVDEATAKELRLWLEHEKYAGMAYMNNHTEKRLNPKLLMPGVKSIVCVALNYTPSQRIREGEYQLASYAYGQDYHDVVKNKLWQLASTLGFTPYIEERQDQENVPHSSVTSNQEDRQEEQQIQFRVFCDTAPVLERYWAMKAGLGWIGKNHQLIIPKAGSMFVLGELFLNIDLEYDREMKSRCGSCHRCIDACPTCALGKHQPVDKDYRHSFDASLCLSYQTIENRGELSPAMADAMGDTIYGCDRCQTACPWNKFAQPTEITELHPKPELLEMTKERWANLSEKEYQSLFKGSAVKRAKYTGLMRNIQAVHKKGGENKNT